MPAIHTIGLISDTHGLLRPSALNALHGTSHILHAGDVGKPEILQQLSALAPVTAVRGNVDKGSWAEALPTDAVLRLGSVTLYMRHILDELDIDPAAAGFHAVLFGHTHDPVQYRNAGVLYVNPGSAGPRRFSKPVTLARLTIDDDAVSVEHMPIG